MTYVPTLTPIQRSTLKDEPIDTDLSGRIILVAHHMVTWNLIQKGLAEYRTPNHLRSNGYRVIRLTQAGMDMRAAIVAQDRKRVRA